jgi:hypothetical protein
MWDLDPKYSNFSKFSKVFFIFPWTQFTGTELFDILVLCMVNVSF